MISVRAVMCAGCGCVGRTSGVEAPNRKRPDHSMKLHMTSGSRCPQITVPWPNLYLSFGTLAELGRVLAQSASLGQESTIQPIHLKMVNLSEVANQLLSSQLLYLKATTH